MPSRRELLVTISALPVLGQSTVPKPKLLTRAELDLVRDLAEAIIPRTDTPGAADAGVHLYIDSVLAENSGHSGPFRKSLARLVRQRKRGRSANEILEDLRKRGDPFFRQIKDLTIDGYYGTKEGLAQELGWHGSTPLMDFPGCTHSEHKG